MVGKQKNLIILLILLATVVVGVVIADQAWMNKSRSQQQQLQARVSTGFPVTITDSLNRQVTIAAKPKKIVSVAPSATEILFAIGAGERVIADTTYCDYPPAADTLPKIGGFTNPNVEKILSLSPDLVLGARGTPVGLFDQMQSLKLTVAAIDAENSLDQMLESIRTIGKIAGEDDKAAGLIAQMEARRQAIVSKTAKLSPAQRPSVLFVFTPGELYSAGKGSFIDELITLGGGVNIAAQAKSPWPQLSLETVIADDPQVILTLPGNMGNKHKPMSNADAVARFRALPRWKSLSAVKNGRVYVLEDDPMTLPGPRLIDGLEATAAAIHPELFKGGQ
ncbi:MAG: ABC transporter substrate-binding protein [Armatimonadota bacterium]